MPAPGTITEDHTGWLETPERVRSIERRQPDGSFAEIAYERVRAPSMELTLDDRTIQRIQPEAAFAVGEVYRVSGLCESGSESWAVEYEVVSRPEVGSVFDFYRGEPRGNEMFLVLNMRDEAEPLVDQWQWWVEVDGLPDYYPEVLVGSQFWVRGLDCGGFGSSGFARGTHTFEVHSAPIGVQNPFVEDGPASYTFECTEDPDPLVDLGCSGGCGCSSTGARGGLVPLLAVAWLLRPRRRPR